MNDDKTVLSAEVRALLTVTLALGSTTDLDELLGMIIRYAMDLLAAERGTLYLYDKETEELVSRVAAGTDEFRISVNTGIAGAAARTREVINIPDAYKDERFNPEIDKKTGFRTRSILTFPLEDHSGGLVGVLQMLNKKEGVFTDYDVTMAEAFAAQAGVAVHRARLVEQYLEKQRLEQAMAVAKEIQQQLFPRESPPVDGFDIACWNRPCDATGGDYSDFLKLNDGRLIVSLGDVTGHGVGPALVSCATRAMLRALSSVDDDIEAVTRRVNTLLNADLVTGKFVTAFLGIVDGGTGTLSYCSAGQGPLLWLHAGTDEVEVLGADGLPLGILPDIGALPPRCLEMALGDVFVLLTDGFFEWARADGELFGSDRVSAIIREHKNNNAKEILHTIKASVESYADTGQEDDLTAIVIKRVGCESM
ncbi:MAG: SpoIIE family protein phosphatase [Sedimentisphaerales bacterium]|nr:SpoIIE family protein phosphatase [Sedimentisphaerales bacterium]